ncbi:PilW family protein, partial [Roseateles sp. P5_E11]
MNSKLTPRRAAVRGATLIELMIGLLLGLVVVLVTAQVLSFAEGQKRVTTGGADAQVNGALGLYTLQREIQMAGYGLIDELSLPTLGCPVVANHTSTGAFNWTLAPVVITAGANG